MSELVEQVADAIELVTIERQRQGFHLVTGRNDSEAFARAALSVLEPRIEALERKVAAVVAAERERCARIAETRFAFTTNAGLAIAAAIRTGEAEQ